MKNIRKTYPYILACLVAISALGVSVAYFSKGGPQDYSEYQRAVPQNTTSRIADCLRRHSCQVPMVAEHIDGDDVISIELVGPGLWFTYRVRNQSAFEVVANVGDDNQVVISGDEKTGKVNSYYRVNRGVRSYPEKDNPYYQENLAQMEMYYGAAMIDGERQIFLNGNAPTSEPSS